MRLAMLVLTASSLLTGIASAQQSPSSPPSRALLGPALPVAESFRDSGQPPVSERLANGTDGAPPPPATPAEASTPVTGKLLQGEVMQAAPPAPVPADAIVLQAS